MVFRFLRTEKDETFTVKLLVLEMRDVCGDDSPDALISL